MSVALEARHLAGRYRRHEDLLGAACSSLEVVDVTPDGLEVLPGDRAIALGARQLLKAGTSLGGELGEVEHVPTGVGWRWLALKASKTILDVGRVVGFAPLAVIDDVQARVALLAG